MQNEPIIHRLQQYLEDTLAVTIKLKPWPKGRSLPVYLQDRYEFVWGTMLDVACLFVIDEAVDEDPAGKIGKRIEALRKYFEGEVIYVRGFVSAYNRQRLIRQKVPFVVPGTQMYLPPIGVDLREHFRAARRRPKPERLSPAAQVVVLNALLYRQSREITTDDVQRRTGYSAMTITRAFDEIESNRLGEAVYRGRRRIMRFVDDNKILWGVARRALRNPVRRKLKIVPNQEAGQLVVAGISALAHCSMLSMPEQTTYAILGKNWDEFKSEYSLKELPQYERDADEVELWRYDPGITAVDKVADPFSLYLSLVGSEDERVLIALEEMMGGILDSGN